MSEKLVAQGEFAAGLVGVIASRAGLAHALRLRRPPDYFELRLDALRDSLGGLARAIPQLRTPLILTARHPAEGGLGKLGLTNRRSLLSRFLAHAALIDLELRSVRQMAPLLRELRRRKIGLILSVHDFHGTPAPAELLRKARSAAAAGADIFKVATRTDTPTQLARLMTFFENAPARLPVAAMGIGKLGLTSRRQLARRGSFLNYVSLGPATVPGQPSIQQLRRTRNAYNS